MIPSLPQFTWSALCTGWFTLALLNAAVDGASVTSATILMLSLLWFGWSTRDHYRRIKDVLDHIVYIRIERIEDAQ